MGPAFDMWLSLYGGKLSSFVILYFNFNNQKQNIKAGDFSKLKNLSDSIYVLNLRTMPTWGILAIYVLKVRFTSRFKISTPTKDSQ